SPCRNRRSEASEDVISARRSDGSVAVVVTLSRIEPAPTISAIARGWGARSAQEIGDNDWVSQTEEFSRVVYRPMVSVVSGVVVLVLAAFLLFDTIRRGSGADAGRLGAGRVLGSLIVYVASIRPAVVAEPRRLVVKNPLRDIAVPWASIRDLQLLYQLDVFAAEETYPAGAVPVTARSRSAALLRQRERADVAAKMGPSAGEYAVKTSHQPFPRQTFDEPRLMLTQRRRNSSADDRVEVSWSWPYVAAIAASTIAFVVALLIR